MRSFAYTARKKDGSKTSGVVEAQDKQAAIDQIERLGCFPVTVEPQLLPPASRESLIAGSSPPRPVSGPSSSINAAALRDPTEGAAFGLLVFCSLLLWVVLAIWVVASFGIALIIIALIALVRLLVQLFHAAHIKTNAVEVSDLQFPEIHRVITNFSQQLGKTPPRVYVMQESVWNAVAMKLAGRRLVVLYRGRWIRSCSRARSPSWPGWWDMSWATITPGI